MARISGGSKEEIEEAKRESYESAIKSGNTRNANIIRKANPVLFGDKQPTKRTGRAAFYEFQRWDDQSATDDTNAESNGRSEAYTSLQAQNTVLQETITELKKALQSSGKDNKKLSKNIADLQKQLKLTKTPEVREADAKRMAREIIKDHSSKANSKEVAEMIKALGDYIVQNNGADLDYDEMIGRARAIAESVVTQARDIINEDDGRLAVLQDAVSTMKGMKLTLAEQDRGELDVAGGYETFRKRTLTALLWAKATWK